MELLGNGGEEWVLYKNAFDNEAGTKHLPYMSWQRARCLGHTAYPEEVQMQRAGQRRVTTCSDALSMLNSWQRRYHQKVPA